MFLAFATVWKSWWLAAARCWLQLTGCLCAVVAAAGAAARLDCQGTSSTSLKKSARTDSVRLKDTRVTQTGKTSENNNQEQPCFGMRLGWFSDAFSFWDAVGLILGCFGTLLGCF